MAKKKKQKREEPPATKGPAAKVAAVVKETAAKAAAVTAEAVKVTAQAAEEYVVEPAKKVLGLKKPKLAKKRYVRPPKRTPSPKPAPIARGTSRAARAMSMGVAKKMPPAEETGPRKGPAAVR
jgi:hypothetical protein